MSLTTSHRSLTLPSYCGRCIEPVAPDSASCPRCETSFAGAGHFLRISGPPPATAPRRSPWEGAARLAAR